MAFPRRTLSVVGLSAALILAVSGCSDAASKTADAPKSTTIELTMDSQPVNLSGAAQKCYDFEGHLMVEAYDKADQDATHFLMDYYKNEVALSIGVKGGHPDLFEYTPGKPKQSATVTRDGNAVSITGTIGVALDDTTPPKPFSIKASCAEFVDTPPDSSSIG